VLTTGPGATIRYLLQSRLDLQATAVGFTLLLQMASADGDVELVQLLVDRNADVNAVANGNVGYEARGRSYGTALHAAARFGHLSCAKVLVEAGAEIALTADGLHWTPLRAAVEGQHLAVVQLLIDCGAMQSYDYLADRKVNNYYRQYSTLTFACRSGSLELVRLLLSSSEPSTLSSAQTEVRRTQFEDMSSALRGACGHGHTGIAALLIEYGAELEAKCDWLSSSLKTATAAGDLKTMKVLLAAGATFYDSERDINILETVMEKAKPKDIVDYVITRLLDTVDFIHACKAVPASMRAWQEDAKFVLQIDTMQGSERLLANLAALGARRSIKLLLERSIGMTDVKLSVLQAAAYFQNHDILFDLLPMVVIPQPFPLGHGSPAYTILAGLVSMVKYNSYLGYEVLEGDPVPTSQHYDNSGKECTYDDVRTAACEAIKKLVQIDQSHIYMSAGILHLASYLGMLQVVQVCLKLGVDINQAHDPFGSALIAGIEGGSFEVVTLLVQHHIDINTTCDHFGSPLYLACKTKNSEMTEFLLRHGAEVNVSMPGKGTVLHQACQDGNRGMTEVLLRHGAEVNVLIPGKGTPIHIACGSRDEELLRSLLTYGAEVDLISPDLGSALHVACKYGRHGLAKTLLQHGANVNMFSLDHGTPLHAACTGYGDDAMIQLLLKHGADVNSKGSKGETPLTSILSQEGHSSRQLTKSLLNTEQKLEATENDLERLVTGSGYSGAPIQVCKRVLSDNTHLKPTIETIRLLLASQARLTYFDSEILRLLLARAPYLVITLDIVKQAKSFESFEILTRHGSCVEITADVMRSFLDPLELNLIKYSVKSAPEIRPPPVVVAAIRAILDQPEPKSNGSALSEPWSVSLNTYQSHKKSIAREIMELILARHPDLESPSSTA
jgi:ankyrin repeat protein